MSGSEASAGVVWPEGAAWAAAPDAPDLATRVNALDGKAPRLIFDCAGARGTIQSAMDLAARDARIIILGINGGLDELRPIVGIGKHLTLQFSQGYNETDELETIAAFGDGSMDTSPIITRTLSLDELRSFSPQFEKDALDALTVDGAVERKAQIGGTARPRVQQRIKALRKALA